MDKWEGEVAVVTGASSGIGKAIALKLAQHGMKVAALARREDKLKELADSFKGKGSIIAYKCDVSMQPDVEKVFNLVLKDLGQVRVLVNNAGVSTSTHIMDFAMDKWRQMFDVNVFGMFTCIKQVVESVRSNNETRLVHIFNVNSIVGHFPAMSAESQVYAATKHCVTALSRGLLKQFGIDGFKNIRITSLSPGVVDTEIFEVGGWKQFDIGKLSYLSPEDVANALLAALSQPENVVISELTVKPAGEMF